MSMHSDRFDLSAPLPQISATALPVLLWFQTSFIFITPCSQKKENERKRREMFDDALAKFKENDAQVRRVGVGLQCNSCSLISWLSCPLMV